MSYRAPTAEQKLLLEELVGIEALAEQQRFAAATPDMVEAIVDGLGDFFEQEIAPLSRIGDTVGARWNDGVVTMPAGYKAAYDAFVANGWGSIDGPVDHGGQGMPYALATVMLEDFGSANLGYSLISMLSGAGVHALTAHGTPEQQALWLPRLISGEWPGTMNLTEPQAGSDVGALRTTAEPAPEPENAGLWRIKGQKIFITFGEHDLADNIVHLVLARTPDAPAGTKGISLFLVPKYRLDADGNPSAANGIRCLSIEHKLGINASPTCVMAFGEDGDTLGELIGPEMGGMRAMFTMMNHARLNVGNEGVAVAERALQQALSYAGQRVQSPRADGSSGGKSVAIVDHPDVRRMLLRMKALTEGARALLYYAAGQVDWKTLGREGAGARVDLLTPLVKAYGTDVGCEVASLGVQVHGGMGFIEETGAAQHYRDARITPIYEGTNGIQAADLVGRKLMGDNGAALKLLIADIRADSGDAPGLLALADAVEAIADWMLAADVNDRQAGSYPFLTMTSVMTAGWLMARLSKVPGDSAVLKAKRVTARYYLDHLVPEALGLKAQAMAGAELLYALSAEELLAS